MSKNRITGYGVGSPQIDLNPPPLVVQRAPTTSDTDYEIGQVWINQPMQEAFIYMGSGTWAGTAGGSLQLGSLTGDTGTATPVSGMIKIAGTAAEITTAASGNTVTLSLPAAITAPGSLTTTTTLTGGTGITATTGNIAASAGAVSASTTVTAGTGVTSTTGNIQATNGNLIADTAGNGLQIKTGSNATLGTSAALSGTPGTLIVATSAVKTGAIIMLTRNTPGGTLGNLSAPVASIINNTSFVINSDANETSTVNWLILNPAP